MSVGRIHGNNSSRYNGLSGAASVHLHYSNPATEALAVTGVSPASGTHDVETDTRISVSFNKPIDATSPATWFHVSAAGSLLPGSYFVVPGSQTVSFAASQALPEGATLQVDVSGTPAQTGPGLAAAFRSEVTVRPARTRIHGVVIDSLARPLAGVHVVVEGTSLDATTDSDGNYDVFLPGERAWTLRFEAPRTSAGLLLPTVRRRLYATAHTTTNDVPLFLTETNAAAFQRVGPTATDFVFNNAYPGLSISAPLGAFSFESGVTTGTLTATQVSAAQRAVPLTESSGPSHLWQLQPAGTRLNAAVTVSFPNVDGLAPGRHALIYGYNPLLHQLTRAGIARVGSDGTTLTSLPPFQPQSLEWFGHRPLTDAEDTAVTAALLSSGLEGTKDGGAQLRRLYELTPLQQLFGLLEKSAWAASTRRPSGRWTPSTARRRQASSWAPYDCRRRTP
jgi:hypothetical protein